MKIITSLAVAGLLCAAVSPEALAQGAASKVSGVNTKGFYAGAALNGSSIQMDDADFGDSDRDNGGGLTLHLGYNFTKMFGVFLSGTAASLKIDDEESGEEEDVTLGQGDIGGRVSFVGSSALVPYIEVAFTGLNAKFDFEGEDVELRGSGATGAIGLNWFFNPSVALDVNARYTKGEFNTIKVGGTSITNDDGIGVNTGRLNVGIAWYPMAKRR
jgi:hypothetical protein